MTAPLSRRRFALTTLATGAGALLATAGFHAVRQHLLAPGERATLSRLASLFPRILLQELTEGPHRTLTAAASIDDLEAFLDPDKRASALPGTPIHAEADTLRFHIDDTRYEIRILLPGDFARQSGESIPA